MWAEGAFNNSIHLSTGESPFFMVFGHSPRDFSFSGLSLDVPAVNSLVEHLSTNWQRVQNSLSCAVTVQKKASPISGSDKVWLSSKNIHLKVPSAKLGHKFIGPFSVSEIINLVAPSRRGVM